MKSITGRLIYSLCICQVGIKSSVGVFHWLLPTHEMEKKMTRSFLTHGEKKRKLLKITDAKRPKKMGGDVMGLKRWYFLKGRDRQTMLMTEEGKNR